MLDWLHLFLAIPQTKGFNAIPKSPINGVNILQHSLYRLKFLGIIQKVAR